MNIRELYEKLSHLDANHEETLLVLQNEKAQIHSDIAGLNTHIATSVANFVSASHEQITVMSRLFKNAGLEFSPVSFVTQTYEANRALRAEQSNVLENAKVTSIDILRSEADRTADMLRGVERRLSDVSNGLASYDTRYLDEFQWKHGFELTPGYLDVYKNAGWWELATNRALRNGRYAAKNTPDFVSSYFERRALKQERENGLDDQRDLSAKFKMASLNIAAYDDLGVRQLGEEAIQAHIAEQAFKALRFDNFADGFAAEMKDPTFLETLVKLRGLEKLEGFIDGKMASLKGERDNLAPALSKLKRAKSSNGSKSVKQDEATIDKAVAGSKIQNAYVTQNVRSARSDTMTYTSSSTDSGFMNQWLFYQMFMGGPASATDPHCAAHICGTHQHDGAGLPAPDYAAAIQTLAADNAFANLSLDGLGISASDLSTISSADLGSISVDVQSAVQSVSDSIATISTNVDTGSISTFSDGGGGFSGGGDGGGGGMCSVAFNDDVAVWPRGFREIRLGERPAFRPLGLAFG